MATSTPPVDKEIPSTANVGDVFQCPICFERLTKPKYLPCLHTFCESCLKTYIMSTQNHKDDTDPETFLCPVCRQEVKSPNSKAPVEEWAKIMPLNYMILSLMENESKKDYGKGDNLCGSCTRIDESTPAQFWCVQCEEGLCDPCNKLIHKRVKNFSNHEIISVKEINEMPPELADIDDPCLHHKGEVLKIYCIDHQIMCCVLCVAVQHRNCKQIRTIEEICGEITTNLNVEKITKELDEIYLQANFLRKYKEKNILEMNRSRTDIKDKVSRMVNDVKLKLDKYHADFNSKLDGIHKQKIMALTAKSETVENFQKTIINGQNMLKAVSEYGSEKHMFVAVQKLKLQVLNQSEMLQSAMEDDKYVALNFKFDDFLAKTNDMDSVAEIKLAEKVYFRSASPLFKAVESFPSCLFETPDITQISAVKAYEIQTESPCMITGGVFLNDGSLLFSDNKNRKLKVYNATGKFKYEHTLDYLPWDVTINEKENKVFVSVLRSAVLRTYIPTHSKLIESSQVKIPSPMHGIDFVNGKFFCTNFQRVFILDNDGNDLETFCYMTNEYVCASKKESKLYCRYCSDLICLSLDGNKLFEYCHPELNNPMGIAEDIFGNIYVCAWKFGQIHLISGDGKSGLVLLDKMENITHPFAIGFDRTGKRFFVTSRDDEPIEIYELAVSKT